MEHGVRAVLINPQPNISELRRFLEMLNFCRSSIPKHCSMHAPQEPKNETKGKYSKHPNTDNDNAFAKCKEQLAWATMLAHPVEQARLWWASWWQTLSMPSWVPHWNKLPTGEVNHLVFAPKNSHQPKRGTALTTVSYWQSTQQSIISVIWSRAGIRWSTRIHKPLTYAFNQRPAKASPR